MRSFLRSRIHGAIVTEADAHNEESIAIDPHLIAAADLMSYEKVEIYNLANGNRFQTFVIESRPGEGTISLNGSAARLGKPGDELTIASFCILHPGQTLDHKPRMIFLDGRNKVRALQEGE